MNRLSVLLVLTVAFAVSACGAFGDALSGHARPAATAARASLRSESLGTALGPKFKPRTNIRYKSLKRRTHLKSSVATGNIIVT